MKNSILCLGLALLLGVCGSTSATNWDWSIAPSGGNGFPTGISYDGGLLTYAVAGKVYLRHSNNGASAAAPYAIGSVQARPVFATLFDQANGEDHSFVFATGSGSLYKFDATSSVQSGTLQVDVVGVSQQVRDLRRAACPTDTVIAGPVVQRRADSNAGYTLDQDIVIVGTAHACGDTTMNQVIAFDASNVTAPPVWVFNSGEYEMGAINACLLDLARNRIYCAAKVPSAASQNGLWAIDTNSGALLWAGLTGSSVPARPAVAPPGSPGEGHVYAGDDVARVHAFDADDGTPIGDPLLLVAPIPEPVNQDLAVGSGAYAGWVFAVAGDNMTAIVDDGFELLEGWKTAFGASQRVMTPGTPLDAYGKLYIGTRDSKFHQLELTSGGIESSGTLALAVVNPTIAPITVYQAADGLYRLVATNDDTVTGTTTRQFRVPCVYASEDCGFATPTATPTATPSPTPSPTPSVTPNPDGPAKLDVDGNGEVETLRDGLLVLRYLFGFRGAVLVAGAVDTEHCSRCDAASIESYLATLTP